MIKTTRSECLEALEKAHKDADSFQLMYNLINQIKKDDAINLEEATDATINNGHIELIKGDNGIYANMYYMTNTD